MGFFDFLKQANINQGIEEYKRTAGAVLLDVRMPQEYQEGHIPESKNVPLQQLNNVVSVVKNTEIPYIPPVVLDVDVAAGRVEVELMEGLDDED